MNSISTSLLICLLFSLQSFAPAELSSQTCLNEEEQRLYELIMEYRAANGLNSIPLSPKLTRVAQLHAKDLAEHYDPKSGQCNLHSWSKNGKWTACCYTDDHKQAKMHVG